MKKYGKILMGCKVMKKSKYLNQELQALRNKAMISSIIKTICFDIVVFGLAIFLYKTFDFSVVYTAIIIIPFLIASLFIFNVWDFVFDKDFEGEIVSKETTEEMVFHHNMNKMFFSVTARAHNQHDYSVENVVNCEIKADDGKIYTEKWMLDTLPLGSCYEIGDRVRHYVGFRHYSKVNNKKDDYVICITCGCKNPKYKTKCFDCKNPLQIEIE